MVVYSLWTLTDLLELCMWLGFCHDRLDPSQRGDSFQTFVEWLVLGLSHHGS